MKRPNVIATLCCAPCCWIRAHLIVIGFLFLQCEKACWKPSCTLLPLNMIHISINPPPLPVLLLCPANIAETSETSNLPSDWPIGRRGGAKCLSDLSLTSSAPDRGLTAQWRVLQCPRLNSHFRGASYMTRQNPIRSTSDGGKFQLPGGESL